MFGGSRESLPLSLLSGNVGEASGASLTNAPGVMIRPSASGFAGAERASVYSSSGIAPALTSERNSLYASKQAKGDDGSVRSGLIGHGRNDSMTNSIGGLASPLVSPATNTAMERVSRRGSGWGDVNGGENEIDNAVTSRGEVEHSKSQTSGNEPLTPSE